MYRDKSNVRDSFIQLKKKLFTKRTTAVCKLPGLVVFTYMIMWQIYEYYDMNTEKILVLIPMLTGSMDLMKDGVMEQLIMDLNNMIRLVERKMNSEQREHWIDLYGLDLYRLKYKVIPLLKLSYANMIEADEEYNKWLIYELNSLQRLLSLSFKTINETRYEDYLTTNYIGKNSLSINFINLSSKELENHLLNYKTVYIYEGTLEIMINLITNDSIKIFKLMSENTYYFINHVQSSLDLFFKLSDFNTECLKNLKSLQETSKFKNLDQFQLNVIGLLKESLLKHFKFIQKLKNYKEFRIIEKSLIKLESNIDSLIGSCEHGLSLIKSIQIETRNSYYSKEMINQRFKNRFNVIVDLISLSSLAFSETLQEIL